MFSLGHGLVQTGRNKPNIQLINQKKFGLTGLIGKFKLIADSLF